MRRRAKRWDLAIGYSLNSHFTIHFYFAEFEYVAGVTGTYRLKVTSFESVNTCELIVTRR